MDTQNYRLHGNDSEANIVIYVVHRVLCSKIQWLKQFLFWYFWEISYFKKLSVGDK